MRRLRSLRLRLALVVTALALGALPFVGRPSSAQAHPLGNFTINRYSRIELSSDTITLRYVLDLAEIPAFQERDAIDDDGDGQISERERSQYLNDMARKLSGQFRLTVNDSQVELRPLRSDLSLPAGLGGLNTQRVVIDYAAPMADGWERSTQRAEYRDDNYSDRIGWREVIVRGADGVRVTDASVASQDVSNELRSYPNSALSDPLHVSAATFGFEPGTGASASAGPAPAGVSSEQERAARGNPDSTLARYAGLIAHDRLSAGVIVVSLLAAMAFGALHALSPGHGKTIVAAYLVGSRGTARHALLLGLTVTATHTSTVYAMGFVTLYLSQYILPEDLYPWLGIASGALILTLGLSLFVGRLRSSGLLGDAIAWLKERVRAVDRRSPLASPALAMQAAALLTAQPAAIDHHHDSQTDHAHEARHAHRHGVGPAHSHAMPGQNGEPVTWRSLIGLGVFGGLLPCPSAIVVMLSAIALHRVAFGMVLIFAFSVGLAAVLTGIGFVLVYARRLSERLPLLGVLQQGVGSGGALSSLAIRAFPAASASAVVVAGLVVTLRALLQQGVL